MEPAAVFQIANTAVLPFWLMLGLIPRHRLTTVLVRSGAVSCVIAALYIISMLQGAGMSPEGFGTLEGIRAIFQNDWYLLAAWLHYLAFDLYVGGTIAGHYVQHGGSRLVLALELFFTLMLGPVGLLLHKVRLLVFKRPR
ncbi:MAG TPA: ABA4-like family protein [Oligoflexus sp.]|uniref:ABA4-like family protein n=1 Tax=Oligoflexus sp. TaxID=1971216 RepID=UPI002D7E452F|nr:ABA4-like family protein [Oligoflexus sp.]HET9241149.1 ABA4-like family protein [Oligoflexus sp.]